MTIMKVIWVFLFIGVAECNESQQQRVKDSKPNISDSMVPQTRDSLQGNAVPTSDTLDLRTARSIELVTVSKMIDSNTVKAPYYNSCTSWTLSKAQIEFVFRKLQPMSSEMQYLAFETLPCKIYGEVKINGTKYEYWLNAGATLTLKSDKMTFYYGCRNKQCSKLFLRGEINYEEEEK